MGNRTTKQSGAVSLFVVIFAALLITVVTVGFLRLMVNDQRQASNADLSQSAYDSALAGVEDGKRALAYFLQVCRTQGTVACDQLARQITDAGCNDALRIGNVILDPEGEVLVQQLTSGNDVQLDQAYTCVTIKLLTDDYIGSLSPGESKLIPLIGKSADGSTDFTDITVEWFSGDDINGTAVDLPDILSGQSLPDQSTWPANRPSVLRTQLMQYGQNFTLEQFDATASGQSNANTLFLYPSSSVAAVSQAEFISRDARRPNLASDPSQSQRNDTPLPVQCQAAVSSGGYACRATLRLPEPVGGGDRVAFLRLSALYTGAHFRVTLQKNGSPVQFNAVQPEIDATGRASDLFRRVATRVDLIDTTFPYPEAALQIAGDFCKSFIVTNSVDDYRELSECNIIDQDDDNTGGADGDGDFEIDD